MHHFIDQDDLHREFKRKCGLDEEFATHHEIAVAEIQMLPAAHRQAIERTIENAAMFTETRQVRDAIDELADKLKDTNISLDAFKDIVSTVQCLHGTCAEETVRKVASRALKKEIHESGFQVSKYPICTVGDIEVYIGGRHDGATDDKIIEIKTRQRRFLGTPLYELVQIHAYMHIFQVREAILIESFDSENKMHPIAFDDALWDGVKDEVAEFVRRLFN
jgi:hypothetical protein